MTDHHLQAKLKLSTPPSQPNGLLLPLLPNAALPDYIMEGYTDRVSAAVRPMTDISSYLLVCTPYCWSCKQQHHGAAHNVFSASTTSSNTGTSNVASLSIVPHPYPCPCQ
ncbi:uncharacterized protein LAJ45_11152 [Morchella importuna]|uniref:uncharacterized protein n=1 Tax=Morchella importuna TaxID=1174673 RepID=UPI001E8C9DC8|nr:uncharacterized protein LAJ45_11152 [Morchella importuna]KAH8144815.1 hypothetical protein LAJ45_11152 [Morchella importuna]